MSTTELPAPEPARGPPPAGPAIVRLAAPIALADVIALAVVVGIVALMARMGPDASYVRSLYLPFVNLFLAVLAGLGISNQVAAARSRGAQRPQDVLALLLSFARVWALLSVVLVAVVAVAAPAAATLLGVAEEHRSQFVLFLRFMAPAELVQVGFVLIAAGLRGYGRAMAGMVVALVAGVTQFIGVAVTGLVLDLGILAVPASVTAGSLLATAVGLVLLARGGLLRPAASAPLWRPAALQILVRVGVPVAGTQVLLLAANAGLLWVTRNLGEEVVSGLSSALSLQILLIMPAVVVGSATAIVLNQQRGAGDVRGWNQGYRAGIVVCATLYTALALTVWTGRDAVAAVLSGDSAAAAEVSTYLAIVGLTYAVQGPVLTALTAMEQLGAGFLALTLNVAYFASIVVVGSLLVGDHGSTGVYATVAGANVVGALVVLLSFAVVRRMAAGDPSRPQSGREHHPEPGRAP